MERLTKRYDTHIAVVCENCDKRLECNGGVICGEVLRDRLAAYEDAMSLEHVQELAQAEKDGRLVVLPPNAPLTREQLDKLNQEPIWIVRGEGEGRWVLVRLANKYGISTYGCGFLSFEDWQVDWWAYRCKPEAALKKREEEDNEAD